MKLINDLAVLEYKNSREDYLDFDVYAKILTESIVKTDGPFTIGVFGEWGSGKTSLLRLIQNKLDNRKQSAKEDRIITVWFNAWKYENEEHPIIPLIYTIIKAIEKNYDEDPIPQKLINALKSIAYAFTFQTSLKVPFLAELGVEFSGKEMVDKLDELMRNSLTNKSLYNEAFECLTNICLEGIKIVIMIDDLDRCFPQKAIYLLESIKLVLSQEKFIYIMGVNRTVIEGYLQSRYKDDYGIDNFNGELYLDKLVQLPFYLPPHSSRINNFTDVLIKDKNEEFKNLRELISIGCSYTPRAIIRFINNLIIDDSIKEAQKSEVTLSYFAITRLLQSKWKNLFDTLINDENARAMIRDNNELDEGFEELSQIIESDFYLKKIIELPQFKSWLSNDTLRKMSIEFLVEQRGERIEGENILKLLINNKLIEGNTVKDFYKKIMDYIISENVEFEGELPFATSGKRYLISLDNKHCDEECKEFKSPLIINDKYYLETHKSHRDARSHIIKFLSKIGMDVDY